MTPSPGTMQRVCAWCGRGMGSVPCAPRQDGQTSHGICEQCEARQQARDVTADTFAPCGAGSCAVSSATAGRDRHTPDASTAPDATRGAPAFPAAAASTPQAAGAGVGYVSAVRLAAVLGISSYLLDTKLRPAHWGAPREMRFSGRETLYAIAALPELEHELELGGLYDLALRLRRWREEQAGAAPWWRKGQYE